MKKAAVLVFLAFALFPLTFTGTVTASISASEQPLVIDARNMLYLSEMQAYANTSQIKDWTIKIYPEDIGRLNDTLYDDSYLMVYLLDVNDTIQHTSNGDIRVYVPSDAISRQLFEIPHTLFYVSMFSPMIMMNVSKVDLEQIANIPEVYCIRILPASVPAPDDGYIVPENGNLIIIVILTIAISLIGSWTAKNKKQLLKLKYHFQLKENAIHKGIMRFLFEKNSFKKISIIYYSIAQIICSPALSITYEGYN